jgi:hypothetical protein
VLQVEAELEIIRTLRFEVSLCGAQHWPDPHLRQLRQLRHVPPRLYADAHREVPVQLVLSRLEVQAIVFVEHELNVSPFVDLFCSGSAGAYNQLQDRSLRLA